MGVQEGFRLTDDGMAGVSSMADSASGAIHIQRRQLMQDLLRRYTVYIDGNQVGKLRPFATGRYMVAAGPHCVELRIGVAGYSGSDVLSVDVATAEVRKIRTTRMGFWEALLAPFGFFNPKRYAPTPWIRLSLEERR